MLDDIQSDESGINMSFNNPLFNEKEVQYEQLSYFTIVTHSTMVMMTNQSCLFTIMMIGRAGERLSRAIGF